MDNEKPTFFHNGEEDEIVQEVDVFLTHQLVDQLALLQYHLRPPWRPYDAACLREVRMKPKANVLEMEYGLSTTEFEYIDASFIVESNPDDENYTIRSSVVPLATNYGIGVFHKDQFHITPLQVAYQMHPDFTKINKADEQRKKDAEERKKAQHKEEGKDEEEPVILQPVALKVEYQESERARASRERSWAHLKGLEDQEQWITLRCAEREEDEGDYIGQLLCPEGAEDVPFNVPKRQYFGKINPPREEIVLDPKAVKEVSFDHIRHVSTLNEQVSQILKRVVAIQWSELVAILPSVPKAALYEALKPVAVPCRGVMVLKSGRFQDFTTHQKNIGNYICYLLCVETEYLEKQPLAEELGVSVSYLQAILEVFTILRDRKWYLKVPFDEAAFEKDFPGETERFRKALEGQKPRMLTNIKTSSTETNKPKTAVSRHLDAVNYEAPTSPESKELIEFLIANLKHYGVMTIVMFRKNLVKDEKDGKFQKVRKEWATHAVLRTHLTEIADNINGAYFLKSLGDPNIDPFRNIVIREFRNNDLKLTKKQVENACSLDLDGRKPPRNIFDKIMRELAYSKQGVWVLKNGESGEVVKAPVKV